MKVKSFAAFGPKSKLKYFEFERRALTDLDVELEVLYCGVCHSDIHMSRNEWADWVDLKYPCVPGHEIVGKVIAIGKKVKQFRKGDLVGVGVLVNSCRKCKYCKKGLEQYCENDAVVTYNAVDPIDNKITRGGYSSHLVVQEDFVFKIPKGMDPAKAAPLLCAGITTYSPLKHWGAEKDKRVGIIGLGGLGHMALKFSKALGAETHVITTSTKKKKDATKYGADGFIVSKNKKNMKNAAKKFDILINTIPVDHNYSQYLSLLKTDGAMVFVGALNELTQGFHGKDVILSRRSIAGSSIGGTKETQEMLNFSAKNNVYADVEIVTIDKINEVFDTMVKKGTSHRYVIDIKNSFK